MLLREVCSPIRYLEILKIRVFICLFLGLPIFVSIEISSYQDDQTYSTIDREKLKWK